MKIKKEQLAEDVILYCGDCREVVPTLKGVDTVISDPPYGIQDMINGYGRNQLQSNDRQIANDKNLKVVGEVFALVRKAIAKNAWVAAFYSCRITPEFFQCMSMFDYFGEVVWDKRAPGLGTQIRYQHENVAFFKVGKPPEINDCMSVISYSSIKRGVSALRNDSTHPHEKPDQVMQNIVQAVPGKLILDPFMGTGSTGAAAVKHKRGFVGIELEPKYFEIALKKVGKAISQPEAFWE